MSQQRILKSRSLQTIDPTPHHNDNFYSGAASQSCNNINQYYQGANNNSDTTTNSNNSSSRNSIDQSYSYGNNSNGFDQNFDIIKGEHYNLSSVIYNVYDSLNSYCNSIKDIYLNSNSFMNNIQKYFGPEHPLSKYGFGVIEMANQGFSEWMDNQQTNFQMLGDYVQELDTVRSKIDRVDQLSLQLNDTNIDEYMALKDELFKDVSNQIDNRINRFDIPLIQTQLSFSSLYQCLNTIHETNGSEKLQQPIQELENPIRTSNIVPDNTFYYQSQSQPLETAQAYEETYQPQPSQPSQPQPQPQPQPVQPQQRPQSNYTSSTMLLSKPVKTEIPHTSAGGPKKLERVGVRDYSRAPPQPSQSSPLKPIPRPQSLSPVNVPYQSPVPSAPPQQEFIEPLPPQQPAEPAYKQSNIFKQVLPVSNSNAPPPQSNHDDSSGVIEQPLRPVPHKSVQARPPLGGSLTKPPLSPQAPQQPQQSQPPPLRPVSTNLSQPPPLRPVSVNLSQQQTPNRSTTQPNPLNQIPRPAPSPYANNNINSPQPPQQSFSKPNASFSRPLPNSVSSVQQSQVQTSFSIPNYPVQPANTTNKPPVNRHVRTNSVDRYSQNH
ncbi:hypothetical protein DICPUDRAFT_159503 [Dictyostelium purpureum]|uniref:BAR domain-containing protein n=1 Tax=Dictyostelium purpureum TaxID=5786 RepID=F1A4A4_DICPU|nr:uncharacterized protein DICPUDRAFT_159503 [Dictyostelium purpureum]EGC28976.1 hypothetical protein DICPUDRAFT_159503 [Dictyostelium purpureum]|eukprot:XP_003294496.1 hypothetical protein DICPUDRAFT_159503 [Dictyostelium purpureum]